MEIGFKKSNLFKIGQQNNRLSSKSEISKPDAFAIFRYNSHLTVRHTLPEGKNFTCYVFIISTYFFTPVG